MNQVAEQEGRDTRLTHLWYSMYLVKQCLLWFVVGKRKSAGAISSWNQSKYNQKRSDNIKVELLWWSGRIKGLKQWMKPANLNPWSFFNFLITYIIFSSTFTAFFRSSSSDTFTIFITFSRGSIRGFAASITSSIFRCATFSFRRSWGFLNIRSYNFLCSFSSRICYLNFFGRFSSGIQLLFFLKMILLNTNIYRKRVCVLISNKTSWPKTSSAT